MITANSRYANDTLEMIKGSDGVNRTSIVLPEPEPKTFAFKTHVITGFDRLDNLAYTFLGDPSLWWQICDINPERIDWTELQVGDKIRIPVR